MRHNSAVIPLWATIVTSNQPAGPLSRNRSDRYHMRFTHIYIYIYIYKGYVEDVRAKNKIRVKGLSMESTNV